MYLNIPTNIRIFEIYLNIPTNIRIYSLQATAADVRQLAALGLHPYWRDPQAHGG